MSWLAVDGNGQEFIYRNKPERHWVKTIKKFVATNYTEYKLFNLPKGSIDKLLGYKLTWKDEPVRINNRTNGNNKKNSTQTSS